MVNNFNVEEILKIMSAKYPKESDLKPHVYSPYKENITIDMPRKKGQYHGSSYVLRESMCYDIEGDAVVPLSLSSSTVDNMKKEDCSISEIHEHAGGEEMILSKELTETQAHIHFKCKNKNEDSMKKILIHLSEL